MIRVTFGMEGNAGNVRLLVLHARLNMITASLAKKVGN